MSSPEQRLAALLGDPATSASMTGDIIYAAGLVVRAWHDCQQALDREHAAVGPEQEQLAAHERQQAAVLLGLAMRALQMAFLISPSGDGWS